MDRDMLILNISRFAAARNQSPSGACLAAGVGKNFVSELKRGKTPGADKVADLAAYLGVSTSDLIGDAQTPADLVPISEAWADLNDDGRAEAVQYVRYLATKPEYKKDHSDLGGEGDAVG